MLELVKIKGRPANVLKEIDFVSLEATITSQTT